MLKRKSILLNILVCTLICIQLIGCSANETKETYTSKFNVLPINITNYEVKLIDSSNKSNEINVKNELLYNKFKNNSETYKKEFTIETYKDKRGNKVKRIITSKDIPELSITIDYTKGN